MFTVNVDKITKKLTSVVTDLENHAVAKTEEAKQHLITSVHFLSLRDKANEEKARAERIAHKLKEILS